MPLDMKILLNAVEELKDKSKKRSFVQSIEFGVNLQDIDPKKPEGRFQELIELPHSVGKGNKICVIASGEMVLKAKKAGVDLALERSDLEALTGDKKKQKDLAKSFDHFIAEAPLMPLVGKILGAILGPQGKMPTPILPTANISDQIKKQRKMVLMRLRGQPVLQCRVGTEDMTNAEITENVQAVIQRIERKLKRGIKNIKSIYLKTTMSSPVKIRV